MAFGIQADTTAGFVNLTTIRAIRRVHRQLCSSTSGSYSPGASIVQNAIPSVEVLDGKDAPWVWVDGSTIRWKPSAQASLSSSNFYIHLVKMV